MKSIIFNTEMVKAILDGRKTQFRKYIKDNYLIDSFLKNGGDKTYYAFVRFSKFQVGDILYVKETFSWWFDYDSSSISRVTYKASDEDCNIKWKPSTYMQKEDARIFLKVTNVRVEKLKDISDDDCLSDGVINLTNYDPYELMTKKDVFSFDGKECYSSAKYAYEKLWNKAAQKYRVKRDIKNKTPKRVMIKKGYSWNYNPYVFVYDFERVEV
jgi:hypothetical protein